MNDATPDEQGIEALLEKLRMTPTMHPGLYPVAQIATHLTTDLSGSIRDLTGNVVIAKKQLVERLDLLTAAIQTTTLEIAKGSAEASRHTKSLVTWTRVLVFATIAYTIITACLLLVAWGKAQ